MGGRYTRSPCVFPPKTPKKMFPAVSSPFKSPKINSRRVEGVCQSVSFFDGYRTRPDGVWSLRSIEYKQPARTEGPSVKKDDSRG